MEDELLQLHMNHVGQTQEICNSYSPDHLLTTIVSDLHFRKNRILLNDFYGIHLPSEAGRPFQMPLNPC